MMPHRNKWYLSRYRFSKRHDCREICSEKGNGPDTRATRFLLHVRWHNIHDTTKQSTRYVLPSHSTFAIIITVARKCVLSPMHRCSRLRHHSARCDLDSINLEPWICRNRVIRLITTIQPSGRSVEVSHVSTIHQLCNVISNSIAWKSIRVSLFCLQIHCLIRNWYLVHANL